MDDRLRNPYTLQHALGKFPQLLVPNIAQAHTAQQFPNALFTLPAGLRKLRIIIQEFRRAQIIIKVWLFR